MKMRKLLGFASLTAIASMSMTAMAQDAPVETTTAEVETEAEADSRLEKVVVTGSLLQNPNLFSTSPITTVGSVDLSLSNTVNAEQFLNTLPQVIPGFDSTSNNPGIGESTVDLRGLGEVRTLVLVNGRRYITSSQNPGVVDLNTIPAALVEQVDILTGGASATYGSDAMSGVVNFTLKDDFEGIQLDTSYETSEQGDGEIFNTSLIFGGNFDNDRGNATLSMEYTSRGSVLQGDRVQSEFTLVDNGTGFSESGSVNIPSTFVLDFGPDFTNALGIAPDATGATFSAVNVAIPEGAALPNCGVEGTTLAIGTNDDDPDNEFDFIRAGANGNPFCTTDSFGWIFNPDGQGALPFINSGPNTNRYNYAPANYLQIPQERFSIFGSANYDVNEYIQAYGQVVFASTQTEQLLAPTPAFESITINLDNPFLAGDTQSLALLSALVDPDNPDSDGDGVDDVTISTGRRFTELGGRLSDIRNDALQFSGGIRGDFNESWSYDLFGSFAQNAASISQTGNLSASAYQTAVREGRANIFTPDGLSQEVVDEIAVTGIIVGDTEQSVISGIVTGDFGDAFKIPTASNPIAVAGGFEYREEALSTRGAGLGPDVRGFNQAPDTFGSFDVTEFFGEVNVPLVQGMTGVEDLSFSGKYRVSDYSTVGSVDSFAAGLSWEAIEGLRFRVEYQQAVRAPNIGELFQPQINGFPGVNDPCSGGDFGGFDDLTAAEQEAARVNCVADGVPAGAVGSPLQVNAQIEGLFGGNPELQEETGETTTIGVVWEPNFIDNLSVTLDYYDISIEDVIDTIPEQTLLNTCYIGGVQSVCDEITRDANGTIRIFNSSNLNLAALDTSGVDISIDYSFDYSNWGTFGIYSLINYTDSFEETPLPNGEPFECAGVYGDDCGEPTPEWTFNTRFDWGLGPWGARLRWTRISEVEDFDIVNGDATRDDFFVPSVDAYDLFDLTGFYDLNDNFSFQIGIENLLDEDYVLIGDDSAEQSNTYPATYDTLGRTFFGRAIVTF